MRILLLSGVSVFSAYLVAWACVHVLQALGRQCPDVALPTVRDVPEGCRRGPGQRSVIRAGCEFNAAAYFVARLRRVRAHRDRYDRECRHLEEVLAALTPRPAPAPAAVEFPMHRRIK